MRRLLSLLVVVLVGCRKDDGDPPQPTHVPHALDASVPSVVDVYAPLLLEVAARARELDRGSLAPSPAVGSKLAADPRIIEVRVQPTARTRFRSLHGNAASGVRQSGVPYARVRDGATIAAMCPSSHTDVPDAVDLHAWTGSGASAIHVLATVHAAGVCSQLATSARESAIASTRTAVAKDERDYLAYIDELLRRCESPAGGLPPPSFAERLDVARVDADCHPGPPLDGGAHSGWPSRTWHRATTSRAAATLDASPLLREPWGSEGQVPLPPRMDAYGRVNVNTGGWKRFGKLVTGGYHPAPARLIATATSGDWRAIFLQGGSASGAEVEAAVYLHIGKGRLDDP